MCLVPEVALFQGARRSWPQGQQGDGDVASIEGCWRNDLAPNRGAGAAGLAQGGLRPGDLVGDRQQRHHGPETAASPRLVCRADALSRRGITGGDHVLIPLLISTLME